MAIDPANNLFWQFPMRRLSAEELRDSVLATSGDLNLEKHGPSIFPDVADEVKATQSRPGAGWEKSSESQLARRSVYIHIKRSLIPPELSVFDFPETDTSCEARFLTTQAAQAMNMLNGSFMQEQSKHLSEHSAKERDGLAEPIRTAIEVLHARGSARQGHKSSGLARKRCGPCRSGCESLRRVHQATCHIFRSDSVRVFRRGNQRRQSQK